MSAREPTATVAVRVDVAPARAFELFVHEIDRWWRRGPEFRHSGTAVGRLRIEPRLDGAITETWPHAGAERTFELGRVTAWEPPTRFCFTWRNATFAPHESTDVEVTFVATGRGTLVTVRHRGYEALRDDHPARHGMRDVGVQRTIGMWWGRLLSSLREFAANGT